MANIKEIITENLRTVDTMLNNNPEREYVFGAAAWIVYTAALVNPDILPPLFVQALKLFRSFDPSKYEPTLIISAGTGAALTVDGARRIAFNRVPFIRAYLSYLKENIANKLKK